MKTYEITKRAFFLVHLKNFSKMVYNYNVCVDLLARRVCRAGMNRCGELGRSGTNEVAWRGLPGTRSMVFSNMIDVMSHPPQGMF